jgi:hypothetical protein
MCPYKFGGILLVIPQGFFKNCFKIKFNIVIIYFILIFSSFSKTNQYYFYYGNLHSHSDNASDFRGKQGAVNFAYSFAKDVAKLDFLAVTDHNHHRGELNGLTQEEYHDGLKTAEDSNEDGAFVAIYGVEFGTISGGGHLSIYESPVLFGDDKLNGKPLYDEFVAVGPNDFKTLYKKMLDNPGKYGTFGGFNHPLVSQFDSFKYNNFGDKVINLIEVLSGPAFSDSTEEKERSWNYLETYIFALESGWHIGAVANQDNHHSNWGLTTKSRTGVVSQSLTKKEIIEALQSRRIFATEDKNLELIFMLDDKYWMGEIIDQNKTIKLYVNVFDPDHDKISKIKIFNGTSGKIKSTKIIKEELNTNKLTLVLEPKQDKNFYFAVIEKEDKNPSDKIAPERAFSSPIWVNEN